MTSIEYILPSDKPNGQQVPVEAAITQQRLNALYITREAWLQAAAAEIASDFEDVGYAIPPRIRFAIAFPSTGRSGNTLGECWADDASADRTHEIFLRADLQDPREVLGVLTHELVHAIVSPAAKHGPVFKKCAVAIGLNGPMRSTTPSEKLAQRLGTIAETLGPLPHAALDFSTRKKQTTRLVRAQCSSCGYIARLARLWVERIGPPHLPGSRRHGRMTGVAISKPRLAVACCAGSWRVTQRGALSGAAATTGGFPTPMGRL